MLTLLLAATLLAAAPDTSQAARLPRRVVAIQDTARKSEDRGDNWLTPDKFMHFSMSYGITAFAYGGARSFANHDDSMGLAVGSGILAGVLKETWDKRHHKPFSLRDLAWDLAGVGVGYALFRNTR